MISQHSGSSLKNYPSNCNVQLNVMVMQILLGNKLKLYY